MDENSPPAPFPRAQRQRRALAWRRKVRNGELDVRAKDAKPTREGLSPWGRPLACRFAESPDSASSSISLSPPRAFGRRPGLSGLRYLCYLCYLCVKMRAPIPPPNWSSDQFVAPKRPARRRTPPKSASRFRIGMKSVVKHSPPVLAPICVHSRPFAVENPVSGPLLPLLPSC